MTAPLLCFVHVGCVSPAFELGVCRLIVVSHLHGLCESWMVFCQLWDGLGSSVGVNSGTLAPMGTDVVSATPVK